MLRQSPGRAGGWGLLGEMFSLIFGTMAIAFAGIGIAGAIVLVVLWRRSKAVEPRRAQG